MASSSSNSSRSEGAGTSELDLYIAALSDSKSDPLATWKNYEGAYPKLAKLACKHLLRVTFLKLVDKKGLSFKVDENDISDVSYEQVIEKFVNPDFILKGKRIYYKFSVPINFFEK
ncbi:hypothetical protein HF086_007643 [Spodoptera exigua]|uniref:Uncharacterized protein n=1 Tax=Spodoptera exigua TaxID=7107 RepID=A0A922MGF1_SPOEX|nr:hypothetical protein HF086_007643 [Spodoptera exigua]